MSVRGLFKFLFIALVTAKGLAEIADNSVENDDKGKEFNPKDPYYGGPNSNNEWGHAEPEHHRPPPGYPPLPEYHPPYPNKPPWVPVTPEPHPTWPWTPSTRTTATPTTLTNATSPPTQPSTGPPTVPPTNPPTCPRPCCDCQCNCGSGSGGGSSQLPCPLCPTGTPPTNGTNDSCFAQIRAAANLSTGQLIGLLLTTLLRNLIVPILQTVLAGNNTVEGAVLPLANILCYVLGIVFLLLKSLGLLGLLGMGGLLDNILGGALG